MAAADLKVSVRKQIGRLIKKEIGRLKKDLAGATGRVTALREEIRQHEQFLQALPEEKKGKEKARASRPVVRARLGAALAVKAAPEEKKADAKKPKGRPAKRARAANKAQKRGPRGAMIDWNAVFKSLPADFTFDTMGANKTASAKPRAYLRQVVVRWSKEGRIRRTGRGMYQKV